MNKESNEDGESKKPFLALLAALLVYFHLLIAHYSHL
jgi:hypothetical protein